MPLSTSRLTAVALTLGVSLSAALVPATAHAAGTGAPHGAASPAATTGGTTETAARVARPAKVLARPMKGRAALAAVRTRLAAVAATNELSASHVQQILTDDDTAWLSTEGRLFYAEEAPSAEAVAAAQTAQATVAPSYPLASTFQLHSRAGSARTIYLDFVGATVSGTSWNTSRGGPISDGTYTGFDRDGNPASFSDAEKAYVQEVWRQVAESYSPFDVDVTTQDPGSAALTRSSSSDTTYGTKVLITSQASPRSQACGGCLGIAYVGTFDALDPSGSHQPAWVFDYSTSFDPMILAQAATHETGHTLGLSHDGTTSSSYYAGTSAWGPVMGSARNRAVTQFSRGEYAGANNKQDDLAVIQSHGLPLRADDHGDTPAAAEQLGQQAAYTASGVISTRSDTDVFAVTLPCSTTLSASATGIGAQTALDLSLQLEDAGGTVLADASPASTWSGSPPRSAGMDASVSKAVAPGTYYLRVDGVGNGDPAGSGWSDYGSLGQYTLRATGCVSTSGTPTGSPSTPPPATGSPTTPPTTRPPATTQPRRPSTPRIGGASSGSRGGRRTVTVHWWAPASAGSAPISGYQVRAWRLSGHSRVLRAVATQRTHASARALVMTLPRGRYTFRVLAVSAAGASPWSAATRPVSPR